MLLPLFLLAAAPTLIGWDRSPRVAGEFERSAGAPAGAPNRPDVVALSGSPDGDETPAARARPAFTPTSEDLAVLAEVNRYRANQGLPAIRYEARLFAAARLHCDEQLRHNYLGHSSPDPERARLSQRLGQEGYIGRMYAEVVATNYFDVKSVVDAWMQSPTHRAVLLDAELSEGAFCRMDASDRQTNRWTGDFGAPVAVKTALIAPPPAPTGVKPSPSSSAARPSALPSGAVQASIPSNPAPRSQPASSGLPAPTSTVAHAGPGAHMARAVAPASGGCDCCPGGVCTVPPPTWSSATPPRPAPPSGYGSTSGSTVPAPLASTLPPPAASAPVRAVQQPTYTRPAPAPYRQPVVVRRRPAPCVGGT
jgi:uncharacterized protein YkwD